MISGNIEGKVILISLSTLFSCTFNSLVADEAYG